MYASHASLRMPLVRFLRAVPVCGNLSRSHQKCWTESLLLRKRDSRLHPQHAGWLIYGSPPSFLLKRTIEAVEKAKHLLTTSYISFWAHISSTWSVSSILTHGHQPSVLNQHRRGLQPWRCWLCTSLSPPFPTVLCFPLMALPDFHLTSSCINQPQK
jgi:hypothetical protein